MFGESNTNFSVAKVQRLFDAAKNLNNLQPVQNYILEYFAPVNIGIFM